MLKVSIKQILFLFLFAFPNTILSFGILYIINNVISGTKGFDEIYLGWSFLFIIIFTYLINIIFQKKLNQVTYNILYENEKKVFRRILKTKLITIEKHGTQRFYTTIEDLRIFSTIPSVITHSINSLLMLVLCLIYMFSLSIDAGLTILGVMVFIASIYFLVMNTMNKHVAVLRKFNESYYRYVNDVIKGFKNLKVNTTLSDNLLRKHLNPNRDQARNLDYNINYVFLSINLISQYGLYLVIGIVLFLLPRLNILPKDDVVSYIVIILFMIGPISNLINMQNIYTRLFVANRRIRCFLNDFIEEPDSLVNHYEKENFQSLVIKNVSFQYEKDSEDISFALSGINLEVKEGEVIFIVGGNGSGKSTFINILTGLYAPSGGQIFFKNREFDDKNKIKNYISPIFTENYIFSHNYDNYSLANNPKYEIFLKLMNMDGIVADTQEESARRNFSKGQSKRMSLIFALLEEKPILVLDEWAADQDPHFRKYFYEVLIPQLREQGKTIIAVTHDDAYFKYADRIIKFDYGQIIRDIKVDSEFQLSML